MLFPKIHRRRQPNNRTVSKTFDIPGWWVISCGILSRGGYSLWSVYTRWCHPVIFAGLWTQNPNRSRQPTLLVFVLCCNTTDRSFMVFHSWGWCSVCDVLNYHIDLPKSNSHLLHPIAKRCSWLEGQLHPKMLPITGKLPFNNPNWGYINTLSDLWKSYLAVLGLNGLDGRLCFTSKFACGCSMLYMFSAIDPV